MAECEPRAHVPADLTVGDDVVGIKVMTKPMMDPTIVRMATTITTRAATLPPVIGDVCHASVCAAAPINQVISPARSPSLNRCRGSG